MRSIDEMSKTGVFVSVMISILAPTIDCQQLYGNCGQKIFQLSATITERKLTFKILILS